MKNRLMHRPNSSERQTSDGNQGTYGFAADAKFRRIVDGLWRERCDAQQLRPLDAGPVFGISEAVPICRTRRQRGTEVPPSPGEAGFLLAAVIVLVFLMLLTMTIAAPKIAMALRRDREIEAQHRANQYVRGIRLYYKKFGHYPASIENLQKSNNQRFVRQKYLDPLTGKDDWRLIHVGENKTKVKGFFGEDLPGLAGGLGSASSLSSGTGGTPGGTSSGSASNISGIGGAGQGASTATGAGSGVGSGVSSQSADDLKGTGGPIMGIGSSKSGEAILTVNEQTNYQDWEFLYDPRIEQLYAKGNLLGGGITSGSPTSNGLGTTPINGPFPPFGGTPSSTSPGPGGPPSPAPQ